MRKVFSLSLTVFVTSLTSTAQTHIPTDGLVAWYPMDGNTRDSFTRGLHGVRVNAGFGSDRFGNPNSACFLSGNNSRIVLPPDSFKLQLYTYSFWLNASSIPSSSGLGIYCVADFGSIGGTQTVDLLNIPTITRKGWAGATYNTPLVSQYLVSQGSLPSLNVWYHLVIVRRSNELLIYINNELIQTDGSADNRGSYYGRGTMTATLGDRYSRDRSFHGGMDDVRIYNRPLDECEISRLFYERSSVAGSVLKLPKQICQYDTFTLKDSSWAKPALRSSQWLINGAPYAGSNMQVIASDTGWLKVERLIETNKRCTARTADSIKVSPAISQPNITIQGLRCANAPLGFAVSNPPALPGLSYRWLIDNQLVATNPDFQQSFPPGSYTLQLTLNAPGRCARVTILNFIVDAIPTVSASANAVCLGEASVFSGIVQWNSTTPGTSKWRSGATESNGLSLSTRYAIPGNFPGTFIATSPNGCKDSITVIARVWPKPDKPVIGHDPPVFIRYKEARFYNMSAGNYRYSWTLPDNTVSSGDTVSFLIAKAGHQTIKVIASSDSGCLDSAVLRFHVPADFQWFMPNAFSANGDNMNDVFKPFGLEGNVRVYSFRIYNRWGAKLFDSSDPAIGWDGTYGKNKERCNTGVYVYTLRFVDLNDKAHQESGTFHLNW
jgi:gliding motility-associated-like protein